MSSAGAGDTLTVRPATHADLPAIQSVAEQTWRVTYAGQIPPADIAAFLAAHYAPARLVQRLGPGLFVATRGDAVIGYAQVGLNRAGQAELFALYVRPEAQGSGVGWRLWQQALTHVRALGQAQLRLWVLATNRAARQFYERQGARLVEERACPLGRGTVSEVCYSVDG